MKTISFERKTLLRSEWFGLDSIQGILNFVDHYKNNAWLCFDTTKENDVIDLYFHFRQLEREGYVVLHLEPMPDAEPNTVKLSSAALTVTGRKLLDELKAKSRAGTVKKRVVDIVWIIVVSVATTLVALWFKGR